METRKEIIKQMGDEMREDIFLEVNSRIERSLRRRFWLRISAVAASVTILFGISNYISFHEGYKKQNSQMVEMVNPKGMRSSVILPDGTKVILNSGTTLSYPTAFVSKQREVKVDGEAFFEVSHDKDHPFIVNAENVKVKVLGTKFNVKAYGDDDNIEVTLAEGKVGVGLDTKNLIPIMPGQQIKYMKASHRFIKREVRLQSYTAWVCGKFYFTNYPLEKIAKQLERSFNVRIQILGNDLKKAAFTGDFVRGENIDQILRVMTANRPIRYKIEGDQITISKK
ncbi:FecR domain-containing protein [uncultured Parabacteroides sp.]|uniref:FecR family protein n=1 Tax=uncultured Parabacteroides sp. TaxID=512312 RepID=UPI002635FF89|nr:FecR domain-containing protein [uncultured Parabacteroides sp.]